MIPKIIHYCWFGRNPLPPLAVKCITSWKKYFPDYEIKEWNEDNFNVNIISYTQEAYEAKKYAFVSDYARFWILYYYGGLYFDTDVEVIKPMDDIIARGAFMGCENEISCAPGLGLGCTPGLEIYKKLLERYGTFHFLNTNGTYNQTTVVKYTTDLLIEYGLKNIPDIQEVDGIIIYPKDFFCPIDFQTKKKTITSNTRTIHHYAASWYGTKEKVYNIMTKVFGKKLAETCRNLLRHWGFV